MKLLLFCLLLTGTAAILYGEQIPLNSLSDWELTGPPANVSKENGVIRLKDSFRLVSRRTFEVRQNLRFQLSLTAKTRGNPPGSYIVGYIPYDEAKHEIKVYEVANMNGFDSVLEENVKAGDTVIRIGKPKFTWKCGAAFCVAFQAADLYRDQPNRETHTGGIREVESRTGYDEVTLAKPVRKNYPAGSMVRLHYYGPDFYCHIGKASSEWISIGGTVSGIAPYGNRKGMWWPGTRYVRVVIEANKNAGKNTITELKDISLDITRESFF